MKAEEDEKVEDRVIDAVDSWVLVLLRLGVFMYCILFLFCRLLVLLCMWYVSVFVV